MTNYQVDLLEMIKWLHAGRRTLNSGDPTFISEFPNAIKLQYGNKIGPV